MTREEALNPSLNSALRHLSDTQLSEVIELYYAGEKVDEILRTYAIDCKPREFVSLLPPEVLQDVDCDYCGLPLWRIRPSRSWPSSPEPYCPDCGHQPIENCNCQNCHDLRRAEAEREEARKRSILLQVIDLTKYDPVHFDELTLKQLTYIGAVLRSGLSEDASLIIPFDTFEEPVAPTADFKDRILQELRSVRALEIHPASAMSCFSEVDDVGSFRFYPYRVKWHLNVRGEGNSQQLIDRLINPPKHSDTDSGEVLDLWKQIALEECVEYLLYNMDQVGFDFSPGEKTRLVITDLLGNFATSQVYGIIWSGVTHASRYFQEGNIPKKRAANSVITNMQRYGEKALTQGWDLKHFSRIRDCQQSAISKIFYNRVLGIGDAGFEKVPRHLYADSETER